MIKVNCVSLLIRIDFISLNYPLVNEDNARLIDHSLFGAFLMEFVRMIGRST